MNSNFNFQLKLKRPFMYENSFVMKISLMQKNWCDEMFIETGLKHCSLQWTIQTKDKTFHL